MDSMSQPSVSKKDSIESAGTRRFTTNTPAKHTTNMISMMGSCAPRVASWFFGNTILGRGITGWVS